MKLADLRPSDLRRAVELYLREAWPDGPGSAPLQVLDKLGTAETIEDLLNAFEHGDRDSADGSLRYALRLGNTQYPFMKFVVQEYLIADEFFFSVDTHDKLDVKPSAPDYAAWQELKRDNRELKERIESAWTAAGLPTHGALRAMCEDLAPSEREDVERGRILVVDDEREVALGLEALLSARGWKVECFFSGEDVLERLQREPLPELLLLDYELPNLNGEQVLDAVRADPRLVDLPVLMATASMIQLDQLRRVSGLLRKPYPRQVLFHMIEQLTDKHGSPGGNAAQP